MLIIEFFKHKKATMPQKDRALVERNAKAVSAIVVRSEDADIIAALNELAEKLKYLIPCENDNVYETDRKIADKLDDVKIAVSKYDKAASNKIYEEIKAVRILAEERNAKI